MSALKWLKSGKHRVFVARKRAAWTARAAVERAQAEVSARRGYSYDLSRHAVAGGPGGVVLQPEASTFPVDHLWFPTSLPHAEGEAAPRRLYLLWTGDNSLTPNRERSLQVIRANNPDLSVELVTPQNLHEYVVDGHPLPATYGYLSVVHRSDYLRAYLMYHHGGIYLDIKPYHGRASTLLEALDRNPRLWAAGPSESPSALPPARAGKLRRDQAAHASRVLNQMSFAFRPHTLLAATWLEEVERRLRYFHDLLVVQPATDPYGVENGYPVPWFGLHSATLSPLALKYHDRVRITSPLSLNLGGFETYR